MLYNLIIFCLVLLLCSPVSAQENVIQVNVSGSFRPVGSQGLLMTKDKVISKPVINVELLANENMLVSIPYHPQEIADGAFATAILFGPQGEIVFGDVKMVTDAATAGSFYALPDCDMNPAVPTGLNQQMGLLESLVEIRAARREAHQLRLKKTLSGSFVDKLSRLERGFGLNYNKKLSADLEAYELVDRLSRLNNAIRSYQAKKTSPQ